MGGLYLGVSPNGSDQVHIDPSRLRTHGVVVGMTGSGKTGLSLVLLEELVRRRVPIVAIDPKGDLGNLGLLFPDFRPEDFAPWCGTDDPRALASRWRSGIERAGLSSDDVHHLREGMRLRVHTPGSTSGVPVNVLASLARPAPAILEDEEALRDLVADTISGLLGLVGRSAEPVRDPSHVVLSHLLELAWRAGEDLDLEGLALRLVDPPVRKVGIFTVDQFLPPDDRMELAMAFNGLLASPSFAVWSQGPTLDPERLLSRSDEATPVTIFSLSHLDDSERQFFVSLLLSRMLAWSRSQPGSEDLRGLVFFDEVAGYLPPHPHRPPSKRPLLTMMKQTRAVGLGVVLATQNPVDLDYKALSNAGLWAIGRLNTKQDRDRLLDGLDAADLDATIAGLQKRQFVLHQVGRGAPATVGSRHAMCFLRGPLTRVEVGALNAMYGVSAVDFVTTAKPVVQSPAVSPDASDDVDLWPAPPGVEGRPRLFLDPRVAFSARFEDFFARHAEPPRPDGRAVYAPALFAEVSLRFDERRGDFVLDDRIRRVWYPLGEAPGDSGTNLGLEPGDWTTAVPDNARYRSLPAWADDAKELRRVERLAVDEIDRTETRGQFVNRGLKLYGRPAESREDFGARCRAVVEAGIESEVAKLRESYQKRADRLDDRIEAKTARLAELEGVAQARQLEEVVGVGATILGLFGVGRKRSFGSALTRRRQAARASNRADALEEEIGRLEEDAAELVSELESKIDAIRAEREALLDETEQAEVGLEESDIQVVRFGVLWVPVTRRI
ncbi:MAG: helicase HerA domain-containing protein [Myxococcota bacterium]